MTHSLNVVTCEVEDTVIITSVFAGFSSNGSSGDFGSSGSSCVFGSNGSSSPDRTVSTSTDRTDRSAHSSFFRVGSLFDLPITCNGTCAPLLLFEILGPREPFVSSLTSRIGISLANVVEAPVLLGHGRVSVKAEAVRVDEVLSDSVRWHLPFANGALHDILAVRPYVLHDDVLDEATDVKGAPADGPLYRRISGTPRTNASRGKVELVPVIEGVPCMGTIVALDLTEAKVPLVVHGAQLHHVFREGRHGVDAFEVDEQFFVVKGPILGSLQRPCTLCAFWGGDERACKCRQPAAGEISQGLLRVGAMAKEVPMKFLCLDWQCSANSSTL